MPRTPLAQELIQVCSVTAEAAARNVPTGQVVEERAETRINRRDFLERTIKLGAVVGGVALLPGCLSVRSSARTQSIVIIGAGLAGLTCAFRLKQAGVTATIYEAAGHLGGRCLTKRGFFDDGQIAERGGELIDSGHKAVRRLAHNLGLHLDDLRRAEPKGVGPAFYFQGTSYSMAKALADFQEIYPKVQNDLLAADYPTLHNKFTHRGRELDSISIYDWIETNVSGGISSPLGRLLNVAYTIEFGADVTEQSALNLLYLLGTSQNKKLQIYGESDERFHIRGGNDQLVSGMAAKLEGQIETGTHLTAIAQNTSGGFTVTLESAGATRSGSADHVVLALPFSILRSSVDYSQAGFSALKQTAIQEQGMGANSKLQLQFLDRHWHGLGCNGETFADTAYRCTWEASRAQPGASGILVAFTGGTLSARANQTTPDEHAMKFLAQIEPVLAGISPKWNRKDILDYWPGYPWSKGSYSYWKVGQYTRFAGIEGVREGNCHFAGEHTSTESQGYLNSAVESGERAAREILNDLRQEIRR